MRKKMFYRVCIHLGLLFLILFTVLPVLWLLSSSLKTRNEIFSLIPVWLPRNITIQNYRWVFSPVGPRFIALMTNTIFVAVITSIVTTIMASMGGYSLGRFRFKGLGVITLILLLSQLFQGPLIMIPWYRIAFTLGILNRRIALILIYGTITIPVCIIIMSSFFSKIPIDLEEAAEIDGCSSLGTFIRISLPLSIPGLVSVFIYSFILCWNDYQYALILTSSLRSKTVQVGIAELMDSLGVINWGGIMAMGILVTVPVVLLFSIIQKFLIEGLTAGAVKG